MIEAYHMKFDNSRNSLILTVYFWVEYHYQVMKLETLRQVWLETSLDTCNEKIEIQLCKYSFVKCLSVGVHYGTAGTWFLLYYGYLVAYI